MELWIVFGLGGMVGFILGNTRARGGLFSLVRSWKAKRKAVIHHTAAPNPVRYVRQWNPVTHRYFVVDLESETVMPDGDYR